MKNIKQFDEFSINESVSNYELINGSGLFFWNTMLDNNTKLEIVNWYNSLSKEEQKYVDILRDEAKEDAYFSANEDESI